ncbi:MAG: dihydrofolate reductase [Pirellulaceae bacterium]|jgi:dihydrofolate reductase|nr:dihydrofolate reductase [Pirellulaceae bacterium]
MPANDHSHEATTANQNWILVAAVSRNGVIGRGDALPWKLRSDLQRFKRMTMGHCLLMGRKTYDSIGRPLPGRQTIVLSRSRSTVPATGCFVAENLSQVSELVEPGRQVMVVGGAEVYRQTLAEPSPRCSTIWLTRVLADVPGDTYFPDVDWDQWQLKSSEACPFVDGDDWPTEFQIWMRRREAT